MNEALPGQMSFGSIEIRSAQRQVLVDGRQISLGARAIDVLLALVAHRDRVVTKQELLDFAWPDLVVEENNLQVQISALRKALGAHAIATVPGRGYQFTATPTRQVASASPPADPAACGNLRASVAPLIGRDREIAELVRQVRADRAVTVVGPGGIGKTRLALAAAQGLHGAFEHGIWLIDLASLSDPALIAATIAQVMSLSLPAGRSAADALAGLLRGRELLIVLDNCEHLLEAAGHLVETLMHHTAMVHVLATSQERLRIADERVYRISPLLLPKNATLEEAADASAVRLFVQRVQGLQAGFDLDEHNVVAIVDICRRLDGLPLAVELAAARVPLLGVAGLKERLDDRFRVLTGGWRTADRRHQTLRDMLDWSCGLLNDAERTVFFRAGVFVGDFSFETAHDVLAGGDIAPADVLDLLGGLVDKSLVVIKATDPPRLRLLETMRAYALERLHESPAEAQPLFRRHAVAMRGLLTAGADQAWAVPSQRRLARMLLDLDNLRAALAWAGRAPDAADIHMSLAGASGWFWLLANPAEGLGYLTAAIERIDRDTAPDVEARLLAGWVALRFPVAGTREAAALARAMALFSGTGNRRGAYEACWVRIRTAAVNRDIPGCQDGARAMEALYDPSWPPIARWELLTSRFTICWLTDSTAVSSVVADTSESLRLAEEFGDLRLRASSLMYLEQASEGLGRFDEAVRLGRELLEVLREVPFAWLRPMATHNLCLSLTHLGRLDEALAVGRDALSEHRLGGTVAMMLDAAAYLAVRRKRFEVAAMTLGRADAAAVIGHGVRQPNELRARSLTLEGLQLALTAQELQRLMQAGARLGDDEAVRLALDVRS